MLFQGKITLNDLPHQEMVSSITGETFSLTSIISDIFNFNDIFVHHEIIPSGRRSSSTHYHTKREEMIYVIEGNVTALLNDTMIELKKGDTIGFPAGPAHVHHIQNNSPNPASILVIASNPKDDEVVYIDSNPKLVIPA